jgi:3-hydroxyisobutyrate dehydrogenase-like beta-hydroxyacid dehydrogenase
MMKDFDLAFAAAKQYDVAMPVTAVTRQYLQAANAPEEVRKTSSF